MALQTLARNRAHLTRWSFSRTSVILLLSWVICLSSTNGETSRSLLVCLFWSCSSPRAGEKIEALPKYSRVFELWAETRRGRAEFSGASLAPHNFDLSTHHETRDQWQKGPSSASPATRPTEESASAQCSKPVIRKFPGQQERGSEIPASSIHIPETEANPFP